MEGETMSSTVRIGAVARSIGVSPTTIRKYEELGKIPAAERTPMGYRVYRAEDVASIKAAIFGTREPQPAA
jgi:DNA-binding transcriptional MerR regulator